MERLLAVGELPGAGWKVLDQRTWRTGVGGGAPWQSRAWAAKSVTAWRSFEQPSTGRGLWIQATPLASSEDCADAIADLPGKSVANLRFKGELVEQHDVAVPFREHSASDRADGQHAVGPVNESHGCGCQRVQRHDPGSERTGLGQVDVARTPQRGRVPSRTSRLRGRSTAATSCAYLDFLTEATSSLPDGRRGGRGFSG